MPHPDTLRRALLAGLIALPFAAKAQTLPPRGGGGGGGEGRQTPTPPAPRADVARGQDGRFEYILSAPQGQVAAARALLLAQGATIQREVPLPRLSRRLLIVDLRNQLSLPQAQALLADTAPAGRLDLHHRYRFAAGQPRLYAPTLLGEPEGRPCPLTARVRVGMIDGPVDASHPALAPARLTRLSVLRDGEATPGADHGTAVAALIVGEDATGALSGFAQGADLVAISAFSRAQGREGADVERIGLALDALLARGVRIINMSFAGPENAVLADLLDRGLRAGALIVAAVGNDGAAATAHPAALPGVVGVTAVDARGRLYTRANTGRAVDIAAPGVELYAAKGRGGGYVSGTSFAAPIVTAYAARLSAAGLSADAFLTRLRAADLGPAGPDTRFGRGLAQAPVCK